MATDELIQWLRDYAEIHGEHSVVRANCNDAADLLEHLAERVDILSAELNDDYRDLSFPGEQPHGE